MNKTDEAISKVLEQLAEILGSLPSTDQIDTYQEKLQTLNEKYHDPEFRLAVIGNFSCGKSTFLNALLERELLSVCDLPTTAIPTYIRWNKSCVTEQLTEERKIKRKQRGIWRKIKDFFKELFVGLPPIDKNPEDPYVTVHTHTGERYTLTGDGFFAFEQAFGTSLPQDIGELIDYVTTTNSLAGKIGKIELAFPEKEDYQNFCLIDTPGVNPGDEASKNHIIQTQSVLREEADAAIILYPAKDAMSKDMERFMEENAAHLLSDTIVLITKMDLVPTEREREKILSRTKKLVAQRFCQNEPVVYGISAYESLEFNRDSSSEETSGVWHTKFMDDLGAIFASLRMRRDAIATKRAQGLLKELIAGIEHQVTDDTQQLMDERRRLQECSLDNLKKEFQVISNQYQKKVRSESSFRQDLTKQIVTDSIWERGNEICELMEAQTSSSKLNRCIKKECPKIMEGVDGVIAERMNGQIVSPLTRQGIQYAHKVESCLENYQRKIGAVAANVTSLTQNDFSSGSSMAIPQMPNFAEDVLENANLIVAIFALPVLLVGMVVDVFRFQARKAETIQRMRQNIEEFVSDIAQKGMQSIADLEAENLQWAENVLKNYENQYNSFFLEIERKFKEQESAMTDTIQKNQEGIAALNRLRGFL